MSAEAKLVELGIELPPAPAALGVYRPVVVVGSAAYTSGHLPLMPDGSLITGRVGSDLDQQAGYAAARQTCLAILASLKAHFGTLDEIRRVIKIVGLVNATPDFTEHPAVINGCSELLAEVFGPEAGVGARSALGVASLPKNVPVEMEGIFEVG
jgi:enamine deaminase RidA (YjgF/YER057c/UK114 family)